ncbi:MAG: cytochrome c biogenesis protein CcsA [Pirellulales bacterium]|nr:cytochrome c biogenesis protein CcsA [Pirellulales bacterium]
MTSGINMLCFTACYAIALTLEALGLWVRAPGRRLVAVVATLTGMVAHTWYLAARAGQSPWAPLSSVHDWYLAAAWTLALAYLGFVLHSPRALSGLFLLPVTLGLIAAARWSSTEPIASFQAPRVWGQLHGIFLMLGAVAVLVGFVAGLMYLIQSSWLKHKRPSGERFRLPSLEWLERVNGRSLAAATVLTAIGFVTGVLTRLAQRDAGGLTWSDPVVASLSGMLSWLIAAECFRFAYPAARRGRKVAYLTLAGFVFLVITLSAFMRGGAMHGTTPDNGDAPLETAPTRLSPPQPEEAGKNASPQAGSEAP